MVRPAYGEASLSELLPGVLAALGVSPADGPDPDPLGLAGMLAGARRVAVLLVDGLGHHQLPIAAPVAPVLADALAGRLGQLLPLTASFPSTTPTSLTSVGTGAAPGAHGIVGFTVNVPGADRLLTHIDWWDDPDPLRWQPLPTQLALAAAAGVAVSVVSRGAYAGSGLTRAAWRGGRYLPADDLDALATHLLAALRDSPPPALVYAYHPDVDQHGHLSGVDSGPWRAAVAAVDRLLSRLVDELPGDAALIVTADHGQLNVPPQCRFDAADPRLAAGLRAVAGEPRVRYLHPVPGAADDVLASWQEVLGAAAWVAPREQVVADGWFGPAVSAAHLPRLGEVVAVCRDRYAVLATGSEPAGVAELIAFHGSWTAVEMVVPLLVVRGGAGA
jgi:hypothetical protein